MCVMQGQAAGWCESAARAGGQPHILQPSTAGAPVSLKLSGFEAICAVERGQHVLVWAPGVGDTQAGSHKSRAAQLTSDSNSGRKVQPAGSALQASAEVWLQMLEYRR
jgi:hypothetical protein